MGELVAAGRELEQYAATVRSIVERREADWWRRIVGDYGSAGV